MLQKTLESPLDCKEIKPVHPKGNLSWIFIGRIDAETETPILWLPDVKNWLIGKDPDAGKGYRQEEKRMTEDEMVGWHHQLEMDMSLSKLWELVMGTQHQGTPTSTPRKPGMLQSMGSQRIIHAKQLNWAGLFEEAHEMRGCGIWMFLRVPKEEGRKRCCSLWWSLSCPLF